MFLDDLLNKYRMIISLLLLAGLTLLCYYPAAGNGFVFDSHAYVAENQYVMRGLSIEGIKWAFSTFHGANWHPLTWISHQLDAQFYGSDPTGHHLTNLLLHLANTILLFIIFNKMTQAFWKSFLVAAVFGLHPLHVESVAWVAERKDVLSAFFWFLATLAYIGYASRRTISRYMVVAVFLGLGLLSKPMIVTLPFVFLLLDYWPLGRFSPDLIRSSEERPARARESFNFLIAEKLPLLLLVAVSSYATLLAQKKGGALRTITEYSFHLRLENAILSYANYLRKFVWPTKLSVYYPHPGNSISTPAVLASLFFLLAVSVLAVIRFRRQPSLPVGWGWYLGTLVPVIGIVQVGAQAMADRYTYIPLIGLVVAIVWAFHLVWSRWSKSRIFLASASVVLLLAMSYKTHIQVLHWRDDITLFEHALAVNPQNSLAYYNLGVNYSKANSWEEAAKAYKQAIKIDPGYVNARFNLGLYYVSTGKAGLAFEEYRNLMNLDKSKAEELLKYIRFRFRSPYNVK